ncbi:MAG: hypothetical protein K1X87_09550 [Dehalococcoidia bacterium]|nr:hypothetical protein [Dehalococcoidia bacterium]
MDTPLDGSSVRVQVRGASASNGVALGRARVVREPRTLAGLQDGEVAVLRCAWPHAAEALGRLAAVVTERGGVLCSLATLTREYGIPCVVGAAGATEAIHDGDVVFVDAEDGAVLVLGPVVAAPI